MAQEKIIIKFEPQGDKKLIAALNNLKKAQDKFITVLKGRILDVAVDVRKGSRTFGKHYKILLSAKNSKFLIWIYSEAVILNA